MSQDLIGCRKRRKLNALIPRLVVFVNDPPSAERKIDFAVFFIVLWSYGRKIYINMYHGNSENSYGCSYLLWICFIYGTNVSVSRSWIPLQVVDLFKGAFWFTKKRVQIKILSILKVVSFESLAGNYFSERGTQAEAHCERNLNHQLWSVRRKTPHRCSRGFCRHYHKSWWRLCCILNPRPPTFIAFRGPSLLRGKCEQNDEFKTTNKIMSGVFDNKEGKRGKYWPFLKASFSHQQWISQSGHFLAFNFFGF